jgi:DNA-directed RNA polymerase specialized sigma24 family protein
VLSQRYVDRWRVDSRVEPLPDDADDRLATPRTSPTFSLLQTVDLIRRVIASIVAALPARDRLRLRCYYAQEMTLAQIGKILAESEATVSRSLARTRRVIRDEVERALRDDEGMSERERADCFAALMEDSGPLDLADLLGPEPLLVDERKKSRRDRSK